MSNWIATTKIHPLTGEDSTTWRKTTRTGAGHVVQYQVYRTGNRYYWSANAIIVHRPDLTRMSWGTFAVTPHSLSAAKGRASRVGNDMLRAAAVPRRVARAA